ncbi:MAG: Ohr family peroxiredoxin [Nocardioides sp.]
MTNTLDKIVYTANATVTGGRRGGHGRTDDGQLEVDLQAPVEMGGPGGGTNPEQLFAIGYGACFTGALGLAGKAEGIDTSGATTDVSVGFGPEGDSFAISVDLAVTIPGVDDPTAQKLVDRTHELCPYSKAIRGNVPVTVVGRGA